MVYEPCPYCGKRKHQLMKCQECESSRTQTTQQKAKNRKLPSGVWCTMCLSNLLPTEEVVLSHFLKAHNHHPTKEEVKKVLANTSRKMFKRRKSLVKTCGKDSPRKRRPEVSGGLPSLGKRR